MKLKLTVTAGPHRGKEFAFDGHDTFLVGRSSDSHFQLSFDDPYFSRRHFVVEMNPPRCRLLDLKSRNGTSVNGNKVISCDLSDGDVITAGHTVFQVSVEAEYPEEQLTYDLATPSLPDSTTDFTPDGISLPGYKLGRELGRGGMGIIFRATRLADGREVAIKCVLPAAVASPRHVDRFLREAAILEKLRHPNIVEFSDHGRSGNVIYLAMELVEGPDCAKVLDEQGQMPTSMAVRIMCQMLKGLAHAHEQGFVHRDIKPSNILIGRDERGKKTAKLADFGLARAFESSRLNGLTLLGEISGTPEFMAPEQVTHFRDVKPAADQYSAAATLYTMLTKMVIHDLPEDIPAQLIHITTADAVPIRERRPDLPKGLAAVIHRALVREANDRFPDVNAFRQALKAFG